MNLRINFSLEKFLFILLQKKMDNVKNQIELQI